MSVYNTGTIHLHDYVTHIYFLRYETAYMRFGSGAHEWGISLRLQNSLIEEAGKSSANLNYIPFNPCSQIYHKASSAPVFSWYSLLATTAPCRALLHTNPLIFEGWRPKSDCYKEILSVSAGCNTNPSGKRHYYQKSNYEVRDRAFPILHFTAIIYGSVLSNTIGCSRYTSTLH